MFLQNSPTLFEPDTSQEPLDAPLPGVPGLRLLSGFLTVAEQAALLTWIDAQVWDTRIRRRTQHYGWTYHFRERRITAADYRGPLPAPLARLGRRMVAGGIFSHPPDEALVNDYVPGVGIAPHTDCEPCFTDTLAALSLGCTYPLELRPVHAPHNKVEVWLPTGSLLVLSGEARYNWLHGIAARKTDAWGGARIPRGRRVSVTFRQVVQDLALRGQAVGRADPTAEPA